MEAGRRWWPVESIFFSFGPVARKKNGVSFVSRHFVNSEGELADSEFFGCFFVAGVGFAPPGFSLITH